MRFFHCTFNDKNDKYVCNGHTSSTEYEWGDLQESVDQAGPEAHGEIGHLVHAHNHLRVLTVGKVKGRLLLIETEETTQCTDSV